jgi:DNA-nicking Smr family endonuclease
MMSDDSTKNDEESLFLSEMSDVKPLKDDNKARLHKKPKTPPRRINIDEGKPFIDDVFSTTEISEDCPEILSFARSGLQHKTLKQLRQGKFPVEHSLDLHGLTVDQARLELLSFLGECETAGIRSAIVVHGKGYRSKDRPVIKPMINRWLRATDKVLAFHSAQPRDGGSGAVYVLFKKAGKPENPSNL